MRIITLFCFFFFFSVQLEAQLAFVLIDSILVKGNKKTRESIILREMLIREGDTVHTAELPDKLERSEHLIMNTGLFNQAAITYKNWEGVTNRVQLMVEVSEAWYIYPVPVFELADRNFNVWWVEQGRSLNRLNFGLDFAHLNITGRKDRLKFSAKYGYTRKYSVEYNLPYINKAQTIGASIGVAYLRNREINYLTLGNKQEFYRDEDKFIYQRFRLDGAITYRPRLNAFHNFYLGFRQNKIDDEISSELNPDFFLDGRNEQRYFLMGYHFLYDKRDVSPYPWKGSFLYATIEKDGLGVFNDRNGLTVWSGYGRYLPFGERWSLGLEAHGKLSLIRERQPYNDNRAIGFGQHTLHGYEYYLMDGLDMAVFKSALRFQIWEGGVEFGKLVPINAFQKMPIRVLLSLNNDTGYANSPFTRVQNPQNNRMLWGGGLGLDIVLYYNKVIQIEYSFNDLWENGLFLHFNMNI